MSNIPLALRLRDFQYHAVDETSAKKMAAIRSSYYGLAEWLCEELPDSRERSLALTSLEESCMRAIQCLAVTEGVPRPIGAV